MDHYMNEYYKYFIFHIISVRLTQFPFQEIDSHNCQLLFELSHNASKTEKDESSVKCYL